MPPGSDGPHLVARPLLPPLRRDASFPRPNDEVSAAIAQLEALEPDARSAAEAMESEFAAEGWSLDGMLQGKSSMYERKLLDAQVRRERELDDIESALSGDVTSSEYVGMVHEFVVKRDELATLRRLREPVCSFLYAERLRAHSTSRAVECAPRASVLRHAVNEARSKLMAEVEAQLSGMEEAAASAEAEAAAANAFQEAAARELQEHEAALVSAWRDLKAALAPEALRP